MSRNFLDNIITSCYGWKLILIESYPSQHPQYTVISLVCCYLFVYLGVGTTGGWHEYIFFDSIVIVITVWCQDTNCASHNCDLSNVVAFRTCSSPACLSSFSTVSLHSTVPFATSCSPDSTPAEPWEAFFLVCWQATILLPTLVPYYGFFEWAVPQWKLNPSCTVHLWCPSQWISMIVLCKIALKVIFISITISFPIGICRLTGNTLLGNKCKECHKCGASFYDNGCRNKESHGTSASPTRN